MIPTLNPRNFFTLNLIILWFLTDCPWIAFLLPAAKKFGVNEFVNPKDYNKPVQEVSKFFYDDDMASFIFITSSLCTLLLLKTLLAYSRDEPSLHNKF